MQLLEGDERAEQRPGLAGFNPRRQQKEQRVEIVLFRDDAIFPQILRNDRRRNPMLLISPRHAIEAGSKKGQLVWIGDGEMLRDMAEAVPCRAGGERPIARI